MSLDPAPPERLAQLEADLEAARSAATWHEEHARRVEDELLPTRERIRVLDQTLVALLMSPAGLFAEQLHALQRALLGSPRAAELGQPRAYDPRWEFKPALADQGALTAYCAQVTQDRDRLLLAVRELLQTLARAPGLPLDPGPMKEAWIPALEAEQAMRKAEHSRKTLEARTGVCLRCGAGLGGR